MFWNAETDVAATCAKRKHAFPHILTSYFIYLGRSQWPAGRQSGVRYLNEEALPKYNRKNRCILVVDGDRSERRITRYFSAALPEILRVTTCGHLTCGTH
ncbi:unnamed protein product [Pieris brassicae]|uniref:Uncharacterized protein n=1 Tax=Pieris brassicae TaxID=7116 RepID=A0A9P0XGC9_PIEBR|nr:unnamed protein product [Pieris brassicae]